MYIDTKKLMETARKLMPGKKDEDIANKLTYYAHGDHNRRINVTRFLSGKLLVISPQYANYLKKELIRLANEKKILFDYEEIFLTTNSDGLPIFSYNDAAKIVRANPIMPSGKKAAETAETTPKSTDEGQLSEQLRELGELILAQLKIANQNLEEMKEFWLLVADELKAKKIALDSRQAPLQRKIIQERLYTKAEEK